MSQENVSKKRDKERIGVPSKHQHIFTPAMAATPVSSKGKKAEKSKSQKKSKNPPASPAQKETLEAVEGEWNIEVGLDDLSDVENERG